MISKKTFLLFFLICASLYLHAQNISISGTVKDTSAYANVQQSVVALFSPGDSILRKFTRVKTDGSFSIDNVKPGRYIMMVTHPLFADFIDDVAVSSENPKLPNINLTPKIKLLEAVIVRSGSAIKVKGDTTVYTADSFKVSANANVEELLKKLPGIQVDKNGEIKAMGEKVEKVLVDGEEFFGDDPGMAVKNLRADAVKEVQVFDKKSEQAEFTGIDDGNTQKTINLKLKEDKKKGYFGKIDVSGGLVKNIDPRYNNNLMFGSFKGKRKISAFFLNGNTGQDGLNWQDNEKYGANDNVTMEMDDEGGMMYMWRGGGSDEEPYVNTENGFIKNSNAGINYNNKWNDKHTFNYTPRFNGQSYDNTTGTLSKTFLPGDTTTVYNETKLTHISRYNIKNNLTYDLKIDSNNSIKLTAKANFYHSESEEFKTSDMKYESGQQLNTVNKNFNSVSDKRALSANAIFKHKFKKLRRTLSLSTDWSLLSTDAVNYNISENRFYKTAQPDSVLDIDQQTVNDKVSNKISGKAVYTEPLSKKYSLELGYEVSTNLSRNNQAIYEKSPADKYDVEIDSLTNNFRQRITINRPSMKISFNDKKIKFNLGAAFGFTSFNLDDLSLGKNYKRAYTNFFPAASFTYSYKSNHSLRINYNGNTTQPTINQLQPLRNNNDLFNQYKGNLSLKPSFSNSFSISHNGYDFLKDRWMYQSLSFNITSNSITNMQTFDRSTGISTISPVNTNGNANINLWSGIGFKSKKIDTRFNIGPNLNYSRYTGFLDGKENISKNLSAGFNLWASKVKDKKYDINLGNDFRFNNNKTSLSSGSRNFSSNSFSANATIYYKKTWSVNGEYEYNWRQKLSDGDKSLNNHLLNAKLQKTFKNNEFTVYLRARDLLNQNIGIDRNFNNNNFTETRNDRLKRYFMLGFAWDFKNKAVKPASSTPK
ncbi:MAG: outer membrane beta-barrel family protein [Ferruginibacter sp.]